MIRSALHRPILFACGILAIAAAAAAMRATSWSPVDAFLDHRAIPESQEALLATDLHPNGLLGVDRSRSGAYDPDAIGSGGFNAPGTTGRRDGNHGLVAGFAHDRLRGGFSPGAAEPNASAGNLWRLMGFVHPHATSTPAAATTHTTTTTTRQSTPKPPAPPHAPSAHASTGSGPHSSTGTGAAPSPAAPAITTPVILIGSNPTPVSGLIGGGSDGGHTGTGAFTPVGPTHPSSGGGVVGGGGGLSATPEPASVLLLGTGLIGLAAIIRRRRA